MALLMLCSHTAHPNNTKNSPTYIGFLVLPNTPLCTSEVAESGCSGLIVVSAVLNWRMALALMNTPIAANRIAMIKASGFEIVKAYSLCAINHIAIPESRRMIGGGILFFNFCAPEAIISLSYVTESHPWVLKCHSGTVDASFRGKPGQQSISMDAVLSQPKDRVPS
jgi:hypothetical protein